VADSIAYEALGALFLARIAACFFDAPTRSKQFLAVQAFCSLIGGVWIFKLDEGKIALDGDVPDAPKFGKFLAHLALAHTGRIDVQSASTGTPIGIFGIFAVAIAGATIARTRSFARPMLALGLAFAAPSSSAVGAIVRSRRRRRWWRRRRRR